MIRFRTIMGQSSGTSDVRVTDVHHPPASTENRQQDPTSSKECPTISILETRSAPLSNMDSADSYRSGPYEAVSDPGVHITIIVRHLAGKSTSPWVYPTCLLKLSVCHSVNVKGLCIIMAKKSHTQTNKMPLWRAYISILGPAVQGASPLPLVTSCHLKRSVWPRPPTHI